MPAYVITPDRQRREEGWRRFTVACVTVAAATLPLSHVPTQMALLLAGVGWVGWSVTSRRIQVRYDAFLLAAGLYWTWNVLASALSVRPAHSLGALVDNEWPALLGLLLWWSVKSSDELECLLRYYFTMAGIAFVYGIIQTFTGVEWIKGAALHPAAGGYFRAVGFSGFYLTFAGFAMSVFFLASGYALQKLSDRLRWVVPALAAAAILGTFARSVWLSMGLLVPMTAIVATKKTHRRWAVGLFVAVFLAVMLVGPLRDRALSVFDLSQHETRLNLWKTSLAIAKGNPWIGIGQDNFTTVFNQYRVEGFYDTFVHPHNDYLSTLVHGGLPAMMAFAATWVIVLRRGWKNWSSKREGFEAWIGLGGTVALAGFLLSSLFQNYYGTFVNCFNWWLITGFIMASYSLTRESWNSKTSNPNG